MHHEQPMAAADAISASAFRSGSSLFHLASDCSNRQIAPQDPRIVRERPGGVQHLAVDAPAVPLDEAEQAGAGRGERDAGHGGHLQLRRFPEHLAGACTGTTDGSAPV
ncbi:hypothetical protein TNCT6_05910 [Streptomyces sp. 6-11-2]|nr:hypothetical protein TNCT6_05910 [Streptomyces sp. 6-11-2]